MHDLSDPEVVAELIRKANKWDSLCSTISEFYCDANGNYSEDNPVRKGDLTDIGEWACIHTGWL